MKLGVSRQKMETWILLSALLAVLAAALFYFQLPTALYTHYRRLRASRQLPGIPGHWLWGNALQIAASFHNWDELVLAFVQKGKHKVGRRWLGPFNMEVEIFHPDPLKQILKEPKAEEVYGILRPWLGDGLLLSSGKKWARNRRLLTPGFHYEILKSYVPVYNRCLKELCSTWDQFAARKEPVKLFGTISLLSLDIILQCAFSQKSNCQTVKSDHPKAVLRLLEMITDRYLNPLHQIDWYYWLTPTGRTMKRYCDLVHNNSEQVIAERKKALGLDGKGKTRDLALSSAKGDRKYLDFLDILLTAEDEQGEGLTDLEIRDEVDTFMFEGHDTTTSAMCWTLYCLAKHPEHQEKVREEVRSVLMGRKSLEYDDLKELKYTLWCIKESMRLYPPVTNFFREVSEDIELEGVVVPKGTFIGMQTYYYHRHPDVWENPNEFDPLRFTPDNSEGRDPFAYVPFSAGNRNCIGQNFALNEARVVVSTIINRFKLTLDPNNEIEHYTIGIFKAKNDISVFVESLSE